MTSVDALASQLRSLGVPRGGTVMVHASLRALGPVDGGPAGVVAALDRVVGPSGTLLMVLGSRDGPEPFDAAHTPADPDVGALAEVFRTRPGTRMSDHPEGRFAARGHRAAELVSDVPWDDYFGPGSPLDRLVHRGGVVLRLGADLDTVTLLHLAEYLADVPDKRRVRRQRLVAAPGGPRLRVIEALDDEHGIVDVIGEDYFSTIVRTYLAAGRAVATGTVGGATAELLDAGDLLAYGVAWMSAHLGRGARVSDGSGGDGNRPA